jgi:DNA polymerase-3 subunit delta
VFVLIDAALGGETARAVRIAGGLRGEGTEMLLVVAMLIREVRSLAGMIVELSTGLSQDVVFKKYRVWPKRKSLVSGALRRHSARSVRDLTKRLGGIDRMVKGLIVGEPWDELAKVVTCLADPTTASSTQV